MSSPIGDDQDDLDRTDRLPVLQFGDGHEGPRAFDPTATVVIGPAVPARVEELENHLAVRERELAALRETLRQAGEADAELEARVEQLRTRLHAEQQETARLRDAGARLAIAEEAQAALDAELRRHRAEATELGAALEAAQSRFEQAATEHERERAALRQEVDQRVAEVNRLSGELQAQQAACTRLEARCAQLDEELLSVRRHLEAEAQGALQRYQAEAQGLRAELEAEQQAHRALREAQSSLEQEKLRQAARQGDEVAQLRLEVARLEQALEAANGAAREREHELGVARRESGRIAALRAGLEQAIRDRDLQIETLLERLRTREARQRLESELRESALAESQRALEQSGVPQRLAAIESAIAARTAATADLESRLAQLLQQLTVTRQDLDIALQAASQATAEAAATRAAAAAAEATASAEIRARTEAEARERAAIEARRSAEAATAAAEAAANAEARARVEAEARERAAVEAQREAEAAAFAAEATASAEARARMEAEARERAAIDARHSAETAASVPGSRYLTRIDDESGVVHILSAPRVVVGRARQSDLLIAESYVSGTHAVLRLGPDMTVVEDSGSTNGVFVNGRRVQREVLHDGDIVAFGRARFRFHTRNPGPQGG